MRIKVLGRRVVSVTVATGLFAVLASRAFGQVTLDGSLCSKPGCQLELIDNQYHITADLGKTVGQNLFHSFDQFSLTAEQMAVFSGPAGLANVISRVTGGQVSNIDGTLQSTITGANFFFVNPAGVVFKPNARLDVSGSFVVTTAGALHLADGGVFGTSIDPADSVLTSAAPSAFGFLAESPAGVSIQGATLSVQEGESLSVIAGDVDIAGGTLQAPAGQVNVVNVASAGQVAFEVIQHAVEADLDAFERLGQLEVRDGSSIDVDGNGGGRVVIRGGRLVLADSSVTARTLGDTDGRGVDIVTGEQVSIVRGKIDTRSEGQGNSGGVDLATDKLVLDARGAVDEVGIFTDSLAVSVPGSDHADLRVTLDITHTFGTDVQAVLESPAGTRVLLFSDVGIGQDFINTTLDDGADTPIADGSAPFTGTFQPEESLTALIGESAQGQWVLEVADTAAFDDGTLDGWSLQLGQSVFESTDVGQTISDEQAPVRSTLPVEVPELVIQNTPTFTPGLAGDIHIESNVVEVFDDVGLSATGDVSVGDIDVIAPAIFLNGAEVQFAVDQPRVGGFLVIGGVVLDGTLGPAEALQGPEFLITADLGTILGSNLFHSFAKFDLTADQTAIFSGPVSVANIISRVTGGQVSNIDGTLQSTIAGANLFFLNPAGVIFGPTADLEVDGSLIVTTANQILLGDSGKFTATVELDDEMLTDTPPSAFGFLTDQPAPITLNAATLTVGDGQSIGLVSGDVQVRGGRLEARRGGINVLSIGARGRVAYDAEKHLPSTQVDGPQRLGNVDILDGGRVAVTGSGGHIDMLAENLRIESGGLILTTASGTDPEPGGDVTVDATNVSITSTDVKPQFRIFVQTGIRSETKDRAGPGGNIHIKANTVEIDGYGGIASYTLNDSPAGDIDISVGHLRLSGADAVGGVNTLVSVRVDESFGFLLDSNAPQALNFAITSVIGSFTLGSGSAGDIDVHDAITIALSDSATIANVTFGRGHGGQITLSANSILATQGDSSSNTAVLATTAFGARGNAGDILVNARDLQLIDGGLISTATLGSGDGGNLMIRANRVVLDGSKSRDVLTGIFVNTFLREDDAGDGGNLTIENASGGKIDFLEVRAAMINAVNLGLGPGGDVSIKSDRLLLDGSGYFAAINASTVGDGPSGSIEIQTSDLKVINGGLVAMQTFGTQDAGRIKIAADTVLIDGVDAERRNGGGFLFTGIYADSLTHPRHPDQLQEASGGVIDLDITSSVTILNGGAIQSATETFGKGGAIDIDARHLELSNRGSISARSQSSIDGSGTAGSITITAAGSIALRDQSTIETSAVNADGGDILVTVGHDLQLINDSDITAEAKLNGGNVTLSVPHFLRLSDKSEISVRAGNDGGNIVINPLFVDLFGASCITANSITGHGGNITIVTEFLRVSPDSCITASSPRGPEFVGNVNIDQTLDLTETLVPVSAWLLDIEAQLQPHCAAQFGSSETSSFTVTGRGGTPITPGGWLPSVDLAIPAAAGPAESRSMVAQDGAEGF